MNLKKKILVACIHYPVCSGRYMARALRRMGHDVKTVGPAMGNQVWGLEVDAKYAWEPTVQDTKYKFSSPGGILDYVVWEQLGDWRPDLVITADSAYGIRSFTPSGLLDMPHVLYGVDNHVRDYETGTDWNYKFLAHSNGSRMEDANTTHLPCAYDPEYFHRDTLPHQRPIHAAMVGVPYPHRVAVMDAIGAAGFKVFATLGTLGEEYNRVYNQAVVSVCLSANQDLAQRVFETAAMGCVILADPVPDMVKLGFKSGEHYLPISGPEGAVRQMQALFDGPDERIAELAENAYRWALPHTWDARCQVILDTVFGGGDG